MDLAGALARGTLDALPLSLAVLDSDGEILAANRAWKQFGQFNGLSDSSGAVGVNYLSVTESAVDDESAREAARGLQEVLDGARDVFTLEYPCHSPTERRWFLMHASRFTVDGERFVVVAHEDVTERKLAELAVDERNEDLELFARVLSHDLRNPLTVAMGRAELLAEETDSEHLDAIESALARIDTLIENALTLAEGRTADLDREPVPLRTLAERAWEHVDTGDATLDVDGEAEVDGDPDLLQNVFENLFRNSVEHGSTSNRPEAGDAVEHGGGDVTVTVGALEEGFYVEDDGPGIPPEKREDVFDIGETSASGHTGFGLGIVRHIVENHGWTVAVTEGESGGARFEIHTGQSAAVASAEAEP